LKVAVAGEFTGWKPDIYLEKRGQRWSTRVTLPNDGTKASYQYKFVINDKDWILNNSLPKAADSNGHPNNCVIIPGSGF